MGTSSYDNVIPPDWTRTDPVGDLVDVVTHAPIRDVEHNGGWIPLGNGMAARDNDPAYMPARAESRLSARPNSHLLLF